MITTIVLLVIIGAVACEEECMPALKGTQHSFVGMFKHVLKESVEIIWLRNKTPVSMCNSDMACYDYSDVDTMTSVQSLGDGMFQFNLTIKKISDQDNALWSIKYLGLASLRQKQPLFSCTLKVYPFSVLTLLNCPTIVEEGSKFNCICQTKEGTQDNLSFGWYNKTDKLSTNNEHLLSSTASRYMQGFQCRGKSSEDKETLPLIYEPLIIANPSKVECTVNYNEIHLNAVCLIEKVFPSAICQFTLKGNKVEFEVGSNAVTYTTDLHPNETLYYNTQCRFQLPLQLESGNYTVDLNVYPNVPGTESDRIYEGKRKFTFNYNHSRSQAISKKSNLTLMELIAIVSLNLILLLVIILTICLIKRKCIQKDKFTEDETFQRNIDTYSKNSCKSSVTPVFTAVISTEKELEKSPGNLNVENVTSNLINNLMKFMSNDKKNCENLAVSDKDPLLA